MRTGSDVVRYLERVDQWLADGEELAECDWCGQATPRLSTGRCFSSVVTDKAAKKTKTTCGSMFRHCAACGDRAGRFERMTMRGEFPASDVPLVTAFGPNGDPLRFNDGKAAGDYLKQAAKSVAGPKRKPRKQSRKTTPKPAPRTRGAKAKPAAPATRTRDSHRRDDLFRMYRAELEAMGTPEALEELARRKAKREAKSAARVAA